MSGKKREKWIDFCKCIAMILVMINHSSLDLPGLKFWGGMFFVPVFFVLSGYTYRSREESFWVILKRKAKRLLLPYIIANGILFAFFFIKNVVLSKEPVSSMLAALVGIGYGRNQLFSWEIPTLFFPNLEENLYFLTCLNSPTWFLPALFLTMVLFELLLRLTKRNGRKMLLFGVVFLCMANLYHYLFPLLLPWSLDAVPYFLIMFMWGYFMSQKEFMTYFDRHKWVLLVLFGVFLLMAGWNGSANYSVGDYGRSTMMALYNALVSSTLLMYLAKKADRFIPSVLAVVGSQTLCLLCYHLFVFSVVETLCPTLWAGITIIITTCVLTTVGWGKEKLIHGKKQRH